MIQTRLLVNMENNIYNCYIYIMYILLYIIYIMFYIYILTVEQSMDMSLNTIG